ncbi:MAG TPA: prepilin-type N-terminal cleavage/methylation domain-containing protein [Leucothrix sp.]|nr:prepilin-type N-terminal cleavage/methylation domain-containing protein [Leucothrix sp.]
MNKHSLNMHKKNGFTLIEALVTVSIASILISIAVPSFKTMLKNNRITAATNEFVTALVLARSEALKRNNNVSVCTTLDQQTCSNTSDFANGWIVFMDCNLDGVIDDGAGGVSCDGNPEQIIKVHDKLSKLSLKTTGAAKRYLSYTFAGRSDTATLKLKEAGQSTVEKTIKISRTGRVRTE